MTAVSLVFAWDVVKSGSYASWTIVTPPGASSYTVGFVFRLQKASWRTKPSAAHDGSRWSSVPSVPRSHAHDAQSGVESGGSPSERL